MNDSPALPSGYLRKAALRKYPPLPQKGRDLRYFHIALFSLCLARWRQRLGCSLPGVYRAQEEYSEQTTRHPSSVMPLLRSGRSLFRGSVTDSWSSWPAPALHHERRTAHILQQEKSRPPRVKVMQSGRLPDALLPDALSVTDLPSSLQRKPLRAIQGGNFRKSPIPSTILSPKKVFSRFPARPRVHRKRGKTYE